METIHSLLPCTSALCFESAPRTLSPGGLHTVGPNLLSFGFCWRWIQSFHSHIFYLLTLFRSPYNSPPDESQVPWKNTQICSPFHPNDQEPTIWSEVRKKNLIHRSLRFSPYVTNEESIIGFTNAFQKYIIPICTNPHPNQDTQLIQGTKYLSPYKWILGSFYVALKIQAIISCLFWEYAGGCSSNLFWASGCWWRLRDHSMQILCCKG